MAPPLTSLVLLAVAAYSASLRPRAPAPAATYLGQQAASMSGRTFHAFSGIRYAQPITKEDIFKEAVLAEETGKIVEAVAEGPVCLQIDPYESPEEVLGSHDCLYLNVYSPNVNSSEKYPVMVWIHGGGWRFGSGSARDNGPELFMDNDIVLVTLNYRLGPIGFSSLEDEAHPGNVGLKDQRVALRWVRRNIAAFGGDPERITLFGYSAGGASVHHHMLSPASSGLFLRGISQSGTALSPWALGTPGVVREKTLGLAQALGCNRTSSQETMACLRKRSGYEILKAVANFSVLDQELVPFRPVLEKEGALAVITQDPWLAQPSNKSWITGTTSAETAFFAFAATNSSKSVLALLDLFYEFFGPQVLMIADMSPEPTRVAKALRHKYFDNRSISQENIGLVIKMLSDAWFTYPTYKAVSMHNGTVYKYYFDHSGEVNIARAYGVKENYGAVHGEEIPYLFNNKKVNIYKNGSDNDKKLSKRMIDLWTNFASEGDPNGKGEEMWKPWREDEHASLVMSSGRLSMGSNIIEDRLLFWDTLPVRRESLAAS